MQRLIRTYQKLNDERRQPLGLILQLWLATLFGLLILLVASVAGSAQLKYRKQCKDSNPVMCVQPIMEGEIAPFGGQLFMPELAIEQAQKVNWFDQKLKLELKRVEGLWVAKLDYEKELHKIDVKNRDDKIIVHEENAKFWKKKAEEAEPWYRHPAFVATMSVIGTGLAIYAAVKVVDAVRGAQ